MFKFFKGKEKGNVLYAPCKGKVVPLTEVPDPTFSEKLSQPREKCMHRQMLK